MKLRAQIGGLLTERNRKNSGSNERNKQRTSTSTAKSSFADSRKISADFSAQPAYESDESDDERSRKNSMAMFYTVN